MSLPPAVLGALCALGSALAWAVIGLFVRTLAPHLSSVTINTVRSLVSAALLIGWVLATAGPSAITGEGVRWAGTMVVEEINALGGIMGHPVEAYFADNQGTPGGAVSAVRKLADVDRVDVIVGQTHSGACLGAMPVVKEIGIPMVIESCSNPKIRELAGKGSGEE